MNIPIALPPTLYFPNSGGAMDLMYNRRFNSGGMMYPFLLNRFTPHQGYGFFDTLKKEGLNIGKRLLKQVGKEALDLGKKYIDSTDTPTEGSGISRKRKRTIKKKRTVSAKKLREALLL